MIQSSTANLDGIPAIVIRDDRWAIAPLLVWYHGWSGDKGNVANTPLFLAQIATQGVVVVCPDCVEHGERQTAVGFRKTFNGWAFICDAMERTRAEAPSLVEAAMDLPFVSPRHAAVAGISMGGVIAQLAFATEQRFTALASVIGRSSLYQADTWCREAQQGTWTDDWCAANAPQLHPERYLRGPVLFIDGGLDTDCPASHNAETVANIRRVGGTADQSVDQETGHGFSTAMQERLVAWAIAVSRASG